MTRVQPEVILDFDYTLFDTARFKRALAQALVPHGVGAQRFKVLYPKAVERRGRRYRYSTEKHLQLLRREVPTLSLVAGRRSLGAVIERSREFLYPEARAFLQRLRRHGFRLVLVTRGDPTFQLRKVRYSFIRHLFYSVVSAPGHKAATLRSVLRKGRPTYFVTDHSGELADVHRVFPWVFPILKLGGHGHVNHARTLKLPAFRNLKNIEAYINRNEKKEG